MEEKEKKYLNFKFILLILFAIGILLLFYARYVATRGLVVKEYPIKTLSLNEDYDGLKIVHFSDLHYGSTVDLKDVKKIVKKINSLNPDIVVFTGDLVENKVKLNEDEVNSLKHELNKINPKVETLAVIGNHDYDHDYWNQIVLNLNWHVLDNSYEYVYYNSKTPIVFVGFDDLLEGTPDLDKAFEYLKDDTNERYTIILTHEPDYFDEFKDYNFNLVLAGHSHLGQVRFPLVGALYTPKGAKKYYDEHYKINDKDMYISGGLGTSTMKIRFMNHPSVNLYRFYTK